MSFAGRIVHAVLFEIFALISIALILPLITHIDAQKSLMLGVFFSLAAMLWSVDFNITFDWSHFKLVNQSNSSVSSYRN